MARMKVPAVLLALLSAFLSLVACTGSSNQHVTITGVVFSSAKTTHDVSSKVYCSGTFFVGIPQPPSGAMRVGERTYYDPGSGLAPCPEWLEADFTGDVVFDLQPIYRNASFLITKATMTFILLDSTHHVPIGTSNSCTADVGTASEAPSVTLATNNKLFPVGDSLAMSFLGKLENNHKFTVDLDLTTVRRWATSPATNFGLV